MIQTILLSALLLLFLWCAVSLFRWTQRNGISPMPTSPAVRKALLEVFPKDISGPILDLGSGWGTLVFPIAQLRPELEIVGYETSPVPFFVSSIRLLVVPYSNLQIHRKDFFDVSLKNVGAVVCYLYPGAMSKLKAKFEKELPPRAWVLSSTFAIPGWEPENVFVVNDLYHTKIYRYRMPEKRL